MTSLALDSGGIDHAFVFVSTLFRTRPDRAEAEGRAKFLVTIGRVEALTRAASEEEFDAAFELLATPRFLAEVFRIAFDPSVERMARAAMAHELAGCLTAAADPRAKELADDLLERMKLLAEILREIHGAPPPMDPKAAIKGLLRAKTVAQVAAAWMVSVLGLLTAAYRDDWDEGTTGKLWSRGRRAVIDLAGQADVPWDTVVDRLITSREKRLASEPFDATASDEAARLLGLQ
jgi:hypothetical protein